MTGQESDRNQDHGVQRSAVVCSEPMEVRCSHCYPKDPETRLKEDNLRDLYYNAYPCTRADEGSADRRSIAVDIRRRYAELPAHHHCLFPATTPPVLPPFAMDLTLPWWVRRLMPTEADGTRRNEMRRRRDNQRANISSVAWKEVEKEQRGTQLLPNRLPDQWKRNELAYLLETVRSRDKGYLSFDRAILWFDGTRARWKEQLPGTQMYAIGLDKVLKQW